MVSIAVSFLTVTNRLATVFRSEDIFSRLSVRSPGLAAGVVAAGAVAVAGVATGALSAFCFPLSAFKASSLVIRPATPFPLTDAGSTPFSANIFAAAGDGVPDA